MNWNRIELVSVKKRTRDCKKWILTDLLGTKKGQTAQCEDGHEFSYSYGEA